MSYAIVHDNRAIAQASAQTQKDDIPLIVLHVFSPQDYIAHDRSARKVDFVLRNLQDIRVSGWLDMHHNKSSRFFLQSNLSEMDIPLYTVTHESRTKIPEFVHDLLQQWKASHLFANMEYEVDELRRDIALCKIAKELGKVSCTFVHDRCIVPPGDVLTKEGRGYTVRARASYQVGEI